MTKLISKTLTDKKISLLIYCLLTIGLITLYISLFPTIKTQAQSFDQVLKSMPPALSKAFNLQDVLFFSLDGYLSVELFSITWPIIVSILLIGLSASILAGEVENRTIGILLRLPVSRIRLFLSKYIASLIYFLIFLTFSILSIIPIAALFNQSISTSHVLLTGLLGFLFGFAIFGLGILFSSMFNEKSKVYMSLAGILLLMYVAKIISSLSPDFEKIKYLSFFYYFNGGDAMVKGIIHQSAVFVFLFVGLWTSIMAAIIFHKKDITV